MQAYRTWPVPSEDEDEAVKRRGSRGAVPDMIQGTVPICEDHKLHSVTLLTELSWCCALTKPPPMRVSKVRTPLDTLADVTAILLLALFSEGIQHIQSSLRVVDRYAFTWA